MNTNHAAPIGSKETFIDTGASHTSLGTEQPEPGLKYLSQSAPGNKPAPQSLADFTITRQSNRQQRRMIWPLAFKRCVPMMMALRWQAFCLA